MRLVDTSTCPGSTGFRLTKANACALTANTLPLSMGHFEKRKAMAAMAADRACARAGGSPHPTLNQPAHVHRQVVPAIIMVLQFFALQTLGGGGRGRGVAQFGGC